MRHQTTDLGPQNLNLVKQIGFNILWSTFCLFILLHSNSAQAQVYQASPQEVLQSIFAKSEKISSEKKTLTAAQVQKLTKEIGYPIKKTEWNIYVAQSGNKIDGYAIIDSEIGKTDPITLLTALSPQGNVIAVEVLVYRESYGGEVREKRFVNQYKGKNKSNLIVTGKDIQHISGATLSSRAMSVAVRRAVHLWNIFYR